MRTIWTVLTTALLVVAGCSSDKKGVDTARPGQTGRSGDPSRPPASDEYLIKFKFWPDAGKTVAIHQTEKKVGSTKTYQGGEWKEEKRDEVRETNFKETVIEGGARLPRKFQRHYEKASRTTQGQTVAFVYEGKTIVFELAGDRYKAAGGDIGPIPLVNLALDANTEIHVERALVPGKPVRLHETWTIQPRKLDEVFAGTEGLIPGKSRGEATLAKVYQNQGKQFGVIEFQISLAIGELQRLRLEPPLTRTFTGSVDAAIDGSSTAITASTSSKLTGKSQAESADRKKLVVEATLETTSRREQSNELSERN